MKQLRRSDRQPTRWLRICIPVVLVLVWLIGGSVGGPYFGKVDEVATNERFRYMHFRAPDGRLYELVEVRSG